MQLFCRCGRVLCLLAHFSYKNCNLTASEERTILMETQDLTEKIAEYVRKYRDKHEMSREELSQKTGISVAHLGRIEGGTSNLTAKKMSSISQLEYTSFSDFLFEINDSQNESSLPLNETDRLIVSKIQSLDDSVKLSLVKSQSTNSKIIPDKFKWAMELAMRLCKGSEEEMVEAEILLLNYYLNNVNEHDQSAKKRLTAVLQHRFNID